MGKKGPCCHCGVESSPLWRNGSPDKPILCNACGSRWRTKGSLLNYMPLHSRGDPDSSENHKDMRVKSISLKKQDQKLNKRKLNFGNTMAMDGEFTPDYNHDYRKSTGEDMSNRSSSGSAISNSESCVHFSSADASDLTGQAQSIVWDAQIPSRKRTCIARPKQSPVEKLTKDLYAIMHEQASQFYGSSEDDLLFESEAPLVSVEIGHGSVLIRHPSSMAREEESEASSLSVDNKFRRTDESYSNAGSLMSLNGRKNGTKFFSGLGDGEKLNGQIMQPEQPKSRGKYNHEKFQALFNHKSPLSYIDLTEIVNFDVFLGYLTDGEQQALLQYLPNVDTCGGFDSLKSMFTSTHLEENLSSYQQLLEDGVLDTSLLGVKTDDCKVLKKLALSNSSKFKWVEHYNILKDNGVEKSIEGRISVSGTKSCFTDTLFSGTRFRESNGYRSPEAKCTMKSQERVLLKGDYKRKGAVKNEESPITPTSRNAFALPTDRTSLILESFQSGDEISDQDILLDVPSNGSFPQAELLCPATSFASQQASASSCSIHPSLIRP